MAGADPECREPSRAALDLHRGSGAGSGSPGASGISSILGRRGDPASRQPSVCSGRIAWEEGWVSLGMGSLELLVCRLGPRGAALNLRASGSSVRVWGLWGSGALGTKAGVQEPGTSKPHRGHFRPQLGRGFDLNTSKTRAAKTQPAHPPEEPLPVPLGASPGTGLIPRPQGCR